MADLIKNSSYKLTVSKNTGTGDIIDSNCYLETNVVNVTITKDNVTNYYIDVGELTAETSSNLQVWAKDSFGYEDTYTEPCNFLLTAPLKWYGNTAFAMWGQYDNNTSTGTIESINLQTLGNSTQVYSDINKNIGFEGSNSSNSKIYTKNRILNGIVDIINPTQMQVFDCVNNTVSVTNFTQVAEQSNRWYGCSSTGIYGFWTGCISSSNWTVRSVRFNLSNLNDSVLWGDTNLGYSSSNPTKFHAHCSNGSKGMISDGVGFESQNGKIYSYDLTTASQCVYWNTLNYNAQRRIQYCSSDSNTNKGFFNRNPGDRSWYYVDMVTTGHLASYGTLSKLRYSSISTTNGTDKGIIMGGYSGAPDDYDNVGTTTNYELFGISNFSSATGAGNLIKNHYWGVGSSGN